MSAIESSPMPALFVGHGNPMNSITDNVFSRAWKMLGRTLPQPKAILAISAHWYISGLRVTAMEQPRTIHDFGGFPQQLFEVQYPAPGNPLLAREIAGLLSPAPVALDENWGLDHGSWSVLRHLFPAAQIPVIQLSLDFTLPPKEHYHLGQKLASLRHAGVLIIGSGNIVHNLAAFNWQNPAAPPPSWAGEFEAWVRETFSVDPARLAQYQTLGKVAALAVPTPDHYLPLLYLAALMTPGETVRFPARGFDGGTMSMLSLAIGQ